MGAGARIYMGRGTEQQSCVLQHGDGASEYRLLRAEDNKQNLQENLSDVNTGNMLYYHFNLNVCCRGEYYICVHIICLRN